MEKRYGAEESNLCLLGSNPEVGNPHSPLCQSSQREELFIIRATFRGTHTTTLCPGPCELRKMDASPHQRYEVLACFCTRRIREQLSLGDFQDNEQFFRNPF